MIRHARRPLPVPASYSCLCFDPKGGCFWAACEQCPSTLFQLDLSFREIDRLCLRIGKPVWVTGIAVQRCTDRLLLSLSSGLALADRTGRVLWERAAPDPMQGVLSLCPCSILWSWDAGTTTLQLLNSNYEVVRSWCFPGGDWLEAAVLSPCSAPCGPYTLCLLVTRRGSYPYLLRCAFEPGCLCQPLCPCNFLSCRPGGEVEDAPTGQESLTRPSPGTLDETTGSIAQMETALSHILNAEGEKLQKAVASTDDVHALLEVNKSVRDTLIGATHLEQTLYQKLRALNGS